MKTLAELNLNFRTVQNSIKTAGTIIIIVLGIALIVKQIIEPVQFTF